MDDKIEKTILVFAKKLPVVGEIIGVLDDLNSIWLEDQEKLDLVKKVREEVLVNLNQLIQEQQTSIRGELGRFGSLINSNNESIYRFKNELSEIKQIINSNPAINQSTELTRILLLSWISLGLSENELPDEFSYVMKNINMLDFKILLHVFERKLFWNSLMPDKKFCSFFPGYKDKEVSASLDKLCKLGYLTESVDNINKLSIEEKAWEPNCHEIDNMFFKLRVIPIIEIMPLDIYAGIKEMREQGTLNGFIQKMSQDQIKNLSHSNPVIRRHPFHGYQWNGIIIEREEKYFSTVSKVNWIGENYQFKSAQEAMTAANKVLTEKIKEPKWIYVNVY